MTDQLMPRLEAFGPSITLLVGENGSGKSRRLANMAKEALSASHGVIALANTVFDRFPRSRSRRYVRLSPSVGKRYAVDAFKRALVTGHSEVSRNASQVGKCLTYTGFSPVVGLHVRLLPDTNFADVSARLPSMMPPEESSTVLRALEIYKNYGSTRQTAWIDMFGASSIGPDRRELLALLSHEHKLKRLGLIESIALTLERDRGIYDLDDASSGELSLLATYACIATHIEEQDVLLIDEPENSLHPRWQRDYCNRLLDQFHYYSPKLVIATHSPHIVEGAENADVDVQLVRMPANDTPEVHTRSIEATLFEVFGILSPASHYLSEKVTFILNELAQSRRSLHATREELRSLANISIDDDQKAFLGRAQDLAQEVENISQSRGKSRS